MTDHDNSRDDTPRGIVQIAPLEGTDTFFVVCDDGSLWLGQTFGLEKCEVIRWLRYPAPTHNLAVARIWPKDEEPSGA